MTDVVHPLTGEVLSDDLESLVAMEKTVDRYLRSLSPHYRFRRALRERIAELRGEYVLPRPSLRTRTQERIALCPRCETGPASEQTHDEEQEAAA